MGSTGLKRIVIENEKFKVIGEIFSKETCLWYLTIDGQVCNKERKESILFKFDNIDREITEKFGYGKILSDSQKNILKSLSELILIRAIDPDYYNGDYDPLNAPDLRMDDLFVWGKLNE